MSCIFLESVGLFKKKETKENLLCVILGCFIIQLFHREITS